MSNDISKAAKSVKIILWNLMSLNTFMSLVFFFGVLKRECGSVEVYVLRVICPPSLIGIGLTYLAKISRDQTPCPHTCRRPCRLLQVSFKVHKNILCWYLTVWCEKVLRICFCIFSESPVANFPLTMSHTFWHRMMEIIISTVG